MLTFHRSGTRLGGTLTVLCLSASCAATAAAQSDDNPTATDTTTCRFVVGQAEIDGVMQQVSGRACLQSDGSWRIVADDPGALAFSGDPVYYYDPWYWGPPVIVGAGVSFVFIDRLHHVHHLDHVRYVRGPYGAGVRGVWRGGAPAHVWNGASRGGGGMRR
ncbi:hypothetical protein LFL96_07890 [Paraburkholderia sp. D15]|uniref:hypothetical protein n=1 Tax=Paraburkholderia sp. D15 TaxID=2880218 RepID=UPI00247A8116|nr:hypothetical protein [Paraburkholderia sp. D15]WGS51410.1 hypothetical protein LFL96_07890 [Paraburkholderia sp. D15]WKF59372.1 hypothetical protein HUO10_003881 [Paraburkholderia busanensis]